MLDFPATLPEGRYRDSLDLPIRLDVKGTVDVKAIYKGYS